MNRCKSNKKERFILRIKIIEKSVSTSNIKKGSMQAQNPFESKAYFV